MLAYSKNQLAVFLDVQHLENHLDPEQSGGTFIFSDRSEMFAKIISWIGAMTLPPETCRSFPGDPISQAGPFVVRAVFTQSEIIGWDSLVDIRNLPDGTKVEWQMRRGYLTKVFPSVSPKPSHTVVLMAAHIDQARLRQKIAGEVANGRFAHSEEHPYWKFVASPSEWVLLTAYPGMVAPPQSDHVFWDYYGFATGPIPPKIES